MFFDLPETNIRFEIPTAWWSFAEMERFATNGMRFFPYQQDLESVQVVPLQEVAPPIRDKGTLPFKKYKLVPILLALHSPECALPPVEVLVSAEGAYRFKVVNGYHRYYVSVAVGYSHLPVIIHPS